MRRGRALAYVAKMLLPVAALVIILITHDELVAYYQLATGH